MAENLLNVFTKQALKAFGHGGSAEMQRRLKEDGQLCATKCGACGQTNYPGRAHCPDCFSDDVAWVEFGDGATLFAFTTQARALRFMAPQVIGVVEIPDVGMVVAPIKGRYETLEIGMKLDVEVVDLEDGLCIHRFVPIASAGD